MSEDPGLFPEGDLRHPPAEPTTAGQRRRDRAVELIGHGLHPLAGPTGLSLPLHPDAPRDVADHDAPGPRCGTCAHRAGVGERTARAYPKCLFRDPEHPQRTRATRSEATDVRASWPGCVDYAPKGDRG